MWRIKFYIVLVLVCMCGAGCTTGSGVTSGEFSPPTVIVPSNVNAVQLLRTLGRGEIRQVAIAPDGSAFAVASTLGIWVYDAPPLLTKLRIPQPTPRLLSGHVGDVTSVAFSADSTRLVSGGEDATVRVWDVASGTAIGEPMRHDARVSSVAFSPNGAVVASASEDSTIRLWDISQAALDAGTFGSLIGEPLRQNNQMTSVAFSPTMDDDRLLLAAGSIEPVIRLWTLDLSGAVQGTPTLLRGFVGSVLSLSFSPDGLLLASGHQDLNNIDNNVHLWDTETHEEVGMMAGHTDGVRSVAFSSNGHLLVSTSTDFTARVWNVASQSPLLLLDDHAAVVTTAVFSPDNTLIFSGGNDGKVRIWDAAVGLQINYLGGFSSEIISVAFSPDGALIAAGTDDNAVHLWDVESGVEVATLRGHRGAILAVAFSPDGTQLASGSRDRTILLWDLEAALHAVELLPCDRIPGFTSLNIVAQQNDLCNTVRRLTGHSNDVRSLTFSADGRLLASGGCAQLEAQQCVQGEIRLWDVDTLGEVSLLLEHENWVDSVAFSPDGSRLASGSRDETIKIWDVETGELVTTLYGQLGSVESVDFSIDGVSLTSGGGDDNVLIWNLLDSQDPPRVLSGHTAEVTDVAFSPNGRLIVSTSLDDHVRVWDVRSTILLGDYVAHIGDVNSVSFRQDGTKFASGGADGTIRLWGVP